MAIPNSRILHPFITITGPSGSGKTTLVRNFLTKHPSYQEAVSYTTRDPRPGEVTGKDYHFISKEEFLELLQADQMVEHIQYGDYHYGVAKQPLEDKLAEGPVLMILTSEGMLQLKQHYAQQMISVFLIPPSNEELRSRMLGRGNDEEFIAKRLASVAEECEFQYHSNIMIYPTTQEETLKMLEISLKNHYYIL